MEREFQQGMEIQGRIDPGASKRRIPGIRKCGKFPELEMGQPIPGARGSWEKSLRNGTALRIFHGNPNIPGINCPAAICKSGSKPPPFFLGFFLVFFFGGGFQGEGEALMRHQKPLGAAEIFLEI